MFYKEMYKFTSTLSKEYSGKVFKVYIYYAAKLKELVLSIEIDETAESDINLYMSITESSLIKSFNDKDYSIDYIRVKLGIQPLYCKWKDIIHYFINDIDYYKK